MLEINRNQIVKDGCMITASGKVIDLFNPNPDDIIIDDIAHGLANNCRWNGHTAVFYSVAEHCMRCSDNAPLHLKRLALFHDCEEAYWGDMIKPLKNILKEKAPEILTQMKAMRMLILDKYGIKWNDEIHAIDHAELMWDYDNLIERDNHNPLKPFMAKHLWIKYYKQLFLI